MWRAKWDIAGFSVTVIEDASGDAVSSQDTHLVTAFTGAFGDSLRLAAIDGVSPTRATPPVAGVDGAVHAANLVRSALLAHRPASDCLSSANTWLQHTYAASCSPRDIPQATVAVADITPDSAGTFSVSATCSGDAEIWVERAGVWSSLFPDDMLGPGVRAMILEWLSRHPDATRDEVQDMERDLLPHEAWTRSAIGRFATTTLATIEAVEVTQVVAATDGAKLTVERVSRLEDYLTELGASRPTLRALPPTASKVVDDLTVLAARMAHVSPSKN